MKKNKEADNQTKLSIQNESKKYWEYFGITYSNNIESKTAKCAIEGFKESLKHISKSSDICLIELGCGSGYLAEYIVKNYINIFKELRFFDISNEMVLKAKQKVDPYINNQQKSILIEERNCEDFTNIESDEYDIIFCHLLIHVIDNPCLLLEGINRCLKNGGIVFISYPTKIDDSALMSKFNKLLKGYNIEEFFDKSLFHFNQSYKINSLLYKYQFIALEESIQNISIDSTHKSIYTILKGILLLNKIDKKLENTDLKQLLKNVKEIVYSSTEEEINLNMNISCKIVKKSSSDK